MNTPSIGIIGGQGRMGKLFADFFASRGLRVLISDLNTKLSNEQLAASADIVIVSVPIDKTAQTIESILPHLRENSALMDFTSIKEMPVQKMLKAKCEVTGLHPMFGNSNPIPGQTIIMCPTRKSAKWTDWLENFFLTHDAKIVKMSAKQHDKMMSVAQALIHFADITFADSLRRTKLPIRTLLQYTGKASELKVMLAARLIDQDPGLYGNIQIANGHAIKSLKYMQKAVDNLIKIARKKDLKAFTRYFEDNKKFLGSYSKEAYLDSSVIIDALKQIQSKPSVKLRAAKKNDLALLGPANTFSDQAAQEYDSSAHKYYAKSIEEVFELVAGGKVKGGIVPIENKLHGSVRESLDALFEQNVHVNGGLKLPIHHCLLTLTSAQKTDIKIIASHSQALNQCKKYLKKNFSKAELKAYPSTAAAAQELMVTNNKSMAVIAPILAAENNSLKVLAKNIEDQQDNSTNFIVIRKGPHKKADPSHKTVSIAFHFDKDSPGSLFSVFQDFAKAKINMSKIESRPTGAQFGDYIFYLDFDGNLSDNKIKQLLATVEKKVAKLKVLGSY